MSNANLHAPLKSSRQRQREAKNRPTARFAAGADYAAVILNDILQMERPSPVPCALPCAMNGWKSLRRNFRRDAGALNLYTQFVRSRLKP